MSRIAGQRVKSHWAARAIFGTIGLGACGFAAAEVVRARKTPHEDELKHSWAVSFMRALPLRLVSNTFGFVMSTPLPTWARSPVYRSWMNVFNGRIEEAELPLDAYPSMAAFFTRRLRNGLRNYTLPNKNTLLSPCDGTVLAVGEVTNPVATFKGGRYNVGGFLGEDVVRDGNRVFLNSRQKEGNNRKSLYFAVIYLGPGDYHRFHSPTDWSVNVRRHFPGDLLSVSPAVIRMTEGLFNYNERVVLAGEWQHGFFSYTAIGATNVGSITIDFDKDLNTNAITERAGDPAHVRVFRGSKQLRAGDEVGIFNMGSCIVLLFEAERFNFNIMPQSKIKAGTTIGSAF